VVSLDCREVRLGRKPLQKNAEILCSWLDYKSIIPGSTKVPKSLAQRSGDSKILIRGRLRPLGKLNADVPSGARLGLPQSFDRRVRTGPGSALTAPRSQ
jgi:hypothetical protein